MSKMLRMTPEQLALYERRAAQRIGVGNCELVSLTRSRGAATAVAKRSDQNVAPIYPIVSLCRSLGLNEPVPEYRFHPTRKWRFDYAWVLDKLALEIDGGVWTQGRHTRGAGAIADMEKLSEAAILGWRVLYAVPDDLRTGLLMDRVRRALA